MSISIELAVSHSVNAFQEGKVVLFPTDTLWGLSASIEHQEAIDKIFTIKQRPANQPLILLVSDLAMLKYYVPSIHPRVETMLHYHNRPLTVIYPENIHLPEELLGTDGSIAIRIAKNPFCRAVIESLGHPIVSTSPNVNGQETPIKFDQIDLNIIDSVDFVVPESFYEPITKAASKIAYLDKKGEIEFLR